MAIISCPECQHEVSDKAAVCPHCGIKISSTDSLFDRPKKWLPRNYKEGRKLNKPIGCATTVAVYFVIVIIAVVGILANKLPSSLATNTSSVVSEEHADFEIVPDSIVFERRTNNSTVYISGKITNYTEQKRYIEIEYAIYDKGKNIIYKDSYLSEKAVEPTKSFKFKIEYYDEKITANSFEILSITGH